MAFVDFLGAQLFALAFAGSIILYMALQGYLLIRKGKSPDEFVKAGAVPLIAIGLYMFISGIFGQLAWPLPGSYNVLFYELYPFAGLLFMSIGVALYRRMKLQYVGFFAFLAGIMSIAYGATGYSLGLTKEPLALLGLYVFFGVAGLLGWPASVLLERASAARRSKGAALPVLFWAFWILLLAGTFISFYIGLSAMAGHLAVA